MKLPCIIVNFKAIKEATGDAAVVLAKIHEKVAHETGASIGIAVCALDLAKVAKAVNIPVFAQHVDGIEYGSYTGHISPYAAKEAGAYGTLLNHSEHRLNDEVLKKSIELAKKAGLFVVVCAATPEKGKIVASFGPDLVAVEPPELIGGDVSVSKAKPEIISDSVRLIGADKVLVGAGVKTGEDARIARELGAMGVLVGSGVTKAKDPHAALLDLVEGLK